MDDTDAPTPRILLVGPAGARSRFETLKGDAEVVEADDVQIAGELLGVQAFDALVFVQPEMFQELRGTVGLQSHVIIETIGQGVAVYDLAGQVLWSNPAMRRIVPETLREIARRSAEAFKAADGSGVPGPPRRFAVSGPDEQFYEVTATAVPAASGRVEHVAAVVWDATSSRQLQRKINAIDMAGRELVRLEAGQITTMPVQERLDLLEEKIIRYTRDLLNFDNFFVALVDEKAGRLEVVLSSGLPEEVAHYELHASPEGSGICGYVAYTGRSYICPDTDRDPRYLPGIPGARSSLTVPLRLQDRVIGVFNVESTRPAAFTEDDRQFAGILGRYIAIALNLLQVLIVEQRQATGRLAEDVAAQIAAPLNDIRTETQFLIDQYIGDDELRGRLESVLRNVEQVRTQVAEAGKPVQGLADAAREAGSAAADPLLAGQRVLLADDEITIRDTISAVLSRLGCRVDVVEDGTQAINRIQVKDYDLILSDIKMPGKTGYEVFAAARQRLPDCAVILITGFGYDPHHSIVRANREGLHAVLFKPFKVDQLLDNVRQALTAAGGTP